MPLVEAALKTNLFNLFKKMKNKELSEEEYAAELAKIFNDHIKTADVNAGIQVDTSGGKGATTSTGSLS